MTDQDVTRALDDLERLLGIPLEHLTAQAVADWHAAFKAAAASAERGPQWRQVQLRAKALGRRLKRQEAMLHEAQKAVKAKLETYGQGKRALAAYRNRGR